jgi:hypothetical protein
MPDIVDTEHDEELSMSIPDRAGVCFWSPAPPADAQKCAATGAPVPGGVEGRLVASGAVRIDGVPAPARFAVRFSPEENAAEPTSDGAREFALRQASLFAASGSTDHGASDAAALELVSVGGAPVRGAPSGALVTVGSLRAVRASFVVDLRQSGHDVPQHVVAYAAWARDGMYTFSVEGDAFHADAVDAFADESARTLTLKDPAPPAPSDLARIGYRLGQIVFVATILVAIVLAVLGARTRRR